MNVQTLITEVTGRAEKIAAQGQEVATIGFDTLKSANGIVVETAQTLAKTNGDAAVAIFGEAKTSFTKATKDGVQAVIANPVAYLPSTTPAVDAFNASVETLTGARGDLVKTLETGYSAMIAKINGETIVIKAKKAVADTDAAVKKTVKTVAKKAKA